MKNTEEANRHLINFSKLIRSFLDSSVSSSNSDLSSLRHSTISLEKEIELLKLYIEFEQLQRPDKFNFEINISPKIEPSNLSIPPLIVQPFVENAIKHGLMYKDDGKGLLKIDLEIENDLLIITIFDNGVGRKKAAEIQNESKKIYKSHGSKLVQDRVKILNELGYSIHIQIIDLEPSGTKVVLYIAD
ncbi:MAG: histidine kinase [Saprospiraceae bacterium]|nr:histidine kinase [Saprospiraceae bacterium]